MPLITLTSDFGLTDHYIAAVKAKLYASDPSLAVIDISHEIDKFNIAHASFVLRSVYRDFPEESVHMIAVGASSSYQECIAVRLDKHFFVGPDNGIISLLNDREPEWIVGLKATRTSTFAARDVMVAGAVALANGQDPVKIGEFKNDMQRKMHRQLKANKKLIAGNVIHMDHYGNLITNIDRFTFDVLSKDASYRIIFGREQFEEIHQCYDDVDFGECALFFNSLQLLEISINQGSAAQLLGLNYDSPVQIHFRRKER
jgi:S-adenosylmethionine hydrolase